MASRGHPVLRQNRVRPATDGRGFGRTQYVLAYTVATGDYPVLERDLEHLPHNTGITTDADVAARVAALQQRIEIIGDVGRGCFAPRLTFTLRDGKHVTGEYHGRELMWDFAKDAQVLRGLVPALPIAPAQYDRLVTTIARLDTTVSVDELVRLTLPEA